tara:strand:- start:66 stop:245 length:180 start_codon:yes stop_codon:yes gene_type:complete
MNWTCCKCENKYDNSTGDVDERMCDECLDDGEEVILEIKKSIQELHPQPIVEVEEVEHQ